MPSSQVLTLAKAGSAKNLQKACIKGLKTFE